MIMGRNTCPAQSYADLTQQTIAECAAPMATVLKDALYAITISQLSFLFRDSSLQEAVAFLVAHLSHNHTRASGF